MKVIILGRGPSCLRCNSKFVNSHDLVVITNYFIYKGYEQYVSNRADIQFRNKSCEMFNETDLLELGLKKIIFSNANGYRDFPPQYKNIEIIKPEPPIANIMPKKYSFEKSTGIIAIYYMIKHFNVSELSLVGFDFYEKNTKPYFFDQADADSSLQYLWSSDYKNDKINKASGHSENESIDFVKDTIIDNPKIKFNIITNSTKLKTLNTNNVNFI